MATIYGITPEGFVPKTERDIRQDIITECQLIQDPSTGEYPLFNIGDDTVLAQVIGIFSNALGVAWGELGAVYAQFDPQLNTGAGQSGTVQLNAIVRKPGFGTQIEIEVEGLAGTTVPEGAAISDLAGSAVYLVDLPIQLTGDTNATVTATGTATATTFKPLSPLANTVNVIQSPMTGWYNVRNTRTLVVGVEEETDPTLRKRQQRSTALTSYRQIEAIWSALYDVDDVTYARAYQNSTVYPADERGIPFKEVAAIVEGGDDKKIAEVLFYRLPTGQIGYGSTTVDFTDRQNIVYPISFSRPVGVTIYVRMTLKIYDSADWPANGVELIKQAIIEYARYNQGDGEVGFPPGTDVVRSRLYTPINSVQGHSILSLELSTDGETYVAQDVAVAWNQLAVFTADNISIVLT